MSSISIVDQKNKFRKVVKRLTSELHVKQKAISEALKIPTHKVAQVVNDRSFRYEDGMLEKLYNAFPQLKGGLPGVDELENLSPEERKEILKKFPKEDIEAMLDEMDREDFLALNAIKEYEQRIKGLEGDKQKLQEEKDRLLRTLENISTNFKK